MKRNRIADLTNQVESKKIDTDFYVEGHATTFERYPLFKIGEDIIYEQIERTAIDNAIMEDVVFLYDHVGIPYARQSNNTLRLEVDSKGLLICADLGKTQRTKSLYEDISTGLVTRMSWAFKVAPEGSYFDESTNTIHITKVEKVVDVSAVTDPANDQTDIGTRSKKLVDDYFLKKDKNRQRKKLEILLKLGGN